MLGAVGSTLVLLDRFDIDIYEQWNVSAGSITDLQYATGLIPGPSVAPIIVPQQQWRAVDAIMCQHHRLEPVF
jgi:hypothetical protein